jgi:U4/U6.U5 tri-snRNP-associated protein 1
VASTKALLEEPDLKRGVGSALELIRRRGLLQKSTQRKHAGRANDHKGVHFADAADDGVRIEHLDEFGRPMTEKEAFRHLSYAFHNQAPGLKKRAKRLKEREREIKMKRLVRGDGEDALNKIQKAVQSAGKAYVVLDAKGRSIASTVAQKKTDIGQPALESSRTSEPSEIHVPETPALASDTSSSTRQTPRIEFELSTR